MKKVYALYITSAILNAYLILLYLGFSAGFASYSPIISLFGSVVLLTIGVPMLVYSIRVGLMVGIISLVLILIYELPFMFMNFNKLVEAHRFQWDALIFSIPAIIPLISLFLSLKHFVKNDFDYVISQNKYVKMVLAGIPVLLFILYVVFLGKYWSWRDFAL